MKTHLALAPAPKPVQPITATITIDVTADQSLFVAGAIVTLLVGVVAIGRRVTVGNGGGVDKEIARADELGIPVFYVLDNLINWGIER